MLRKSNDINVTDSRLIKLLDVMKVLTSTLKPDEVLQRIVVAATDVMPCESCILWIFDDRKQKLVSETIHGFSWGEVGEHMFDPGEGTIGTAFLSKEPVITNNLKEYTKFVRKGDVVDRIVSMLDVPLIFKGQAIGVLDATNKIPDNDFNEQDAQLLLILAAQAAVALENAQIHAQVQRKAYELNTLHSITQSIGTNLNANDVLKIIVDQTSKLLNSHDCSIFLYDEKKKDLVLAIAKGLRKPYIGTMRVSLTDGLIAYVAKTKRTKLVSGSDLDKYCDYPPGDYVSFKTVVASAMSLPDKLIGVVEIRDPQKRNLSNETLLLFKTITMQMAVFLEKANLFQTVQEIYLNVIKSLSETVEAKDPETIGHCSRVEDWAAKIANKLTLDEEMVEQIQVAAHLHDIGKIGVSESILMKTTKLSKNEIAELKRHPGVGAKILSPIKQFGDISILVKHHHEHYNGSGYPDGLSGDQIPLGSRIIAVADSFEAMTWNRYYNRRLSKHEALNEIKRCSGTQFDPAVVKAFNTVFNEIF